MENEKKRIEDFGNKIGGAKKDLAGKKKQNLTIEDTATWNEQERKEYIKKKAVWVEPDYKQMVEDGADKVCVYFIKLIRDKLPAKPSAGWSADDDIREQEAYIQYISEVRDMALQIKTKEDIPKIAAKITSSFTKYEHNRLYATNSYFSNKLYRILNKSYRSLEHEMNDKQFLWEDREKLLAAYNIGKVAAVSHNTDWNRLDITEETENGGQRGKMYYSSENNDRFFSENEWETGKFYIYDNKRQILDINFDTKEAAEEYILQYGNIESSRKEANRRKRFVPPLLEVIRREGSDYRQNIDADGQAMLDTFGFYGGEFGNWERQTERQMNLNFAYDAFKDLAYALDIDDKDVSLGGNLSLAFGARGSGNALGYTEIGSEEQGDYSFQVEADLINCEINYYIDGEIAKTEKYDSLAEMNECRLSCLDFDEFLHIGTTELDRILEEKEKAAPVKVVLAVSQCDTNRYYIANNATEASVRNIISNSDKIFMDICALGGKQIDEATFAKYSQTEGITAIDVNIDEQIMHVYDAEKPITTFDDIRSNIIRQSDFINQLDEVIATCQKMKEALINGEVDLDRDQHSVGQER